MTLNKHQITNLTKEYLELKKNLSYIQEDEKDIFIINHCPKIVKELDSIFEEQLKTKKVNQKFLQFFDEHELESLVDVYVDEKTSEGKFIEELQELENMRTDDNFSIYMREITKIPLYTPEEEYEAFKKLSDIKIKLKQKATMGFLKSRPNFIGPVSDQELEPYYTKLDKIEIKKQIDEIAAHNLRLVIKMATRRTTTYHNEKEDMVQYGNEGLLDAINKFDYKKGFKFSTYAYWWIKQRISRGIIDNENTIRIPVHLREAMYKYYRTIEIYENDYGEKPSKEYLQKTLNLSEEKLEQMEQITNDYLKTKSLDAPVKEEENKSFGELYIEGKESVEEDIITKNLTLDVHKLLKTTKNLSDREKEILKMRYGINKENICYTLEDVGRSLNLTRERIRQIESKALRKLKNPAKQLQLNEYITESENSYKGKTEKSDDGLDYAKLKSISKAIGKDLTFYNYNTEIPYSKKLDEIIQYKEQYNLTVNEMAYLCGMSRGTLQNYIKYRKFPKEIKDLVDSKQIKLTHGVILLTALKTHPEIYPELLELCQNTPVSTSDVQKKYYTYIDKQKKLKKAKI